jgi:hypothetical protein
MFHYWDPISRGVYYREHGVAVGAAHVAQVLGLRDQIHACLLSSVGGTKGTRGGGRGRWCVSRELASARREEASRRACVPASRARELLIKRKGPGWRGAREVEEEEEVELAQPNAREREKVSWVPREDGGRVSIPAIMPWAPRTHGSVRTRPTTAIDRAGGGGHTHHAPHHTTHDLFLETHTVVLA